MTYGTTHREDKRGQAQEFSFREGSEMTTVVQTSLDLDEPGARWRRDTRIIQKVVLLENELGRRPLTMLGLLCRFDRRELDSVSDILHWLVVEG